MTISKTRLRVSTDDNLIIPRLRSMGDALELPSGVGVRFGETVVDLLSCDGLAMGEAVGILLRRIVEIAADLDVVFAVSVERVESLRGFDDAVVSSVRGVIEDHGPEPREMESEDAPECSGSLLCVGTGGDGRLEAALRKMT